jgi:hypothetical protein
VKLQNRLVVRVKVTPERPSGWNYEGEMDEYVGQLVLINDIDLEDRYSIGCEPLFKLINEYNQWVFTEKDFVKANTIQDEIPYWAIDGKRRTESRTKGKPYRDYEDYHDDSQDTNGFIEDLLKGDDE